MMTSFRVEDLDPVIVHVLNGCWSRSDCQELETRCRLMTPRYARFVLDEVDDPEAEAIAEMVRLLGTLTALGIECEVLSPPQMLAHTLYKTDLMRRGVTIRGPRDEEPYAG